MNIQKTISYQPEIIDSKENNFVVGVTSQIMKDGLFGPLQKDCKILKNWLI